MKKIVLSENEMPQAWYNVQADLQVPLAPPLHPATHEPLEPGELEKIFPRSLIEQEMSRERWIEIPDEIQNVLKIWRPSPLVRAPVLMAFEKKILGLAGARASSSGRMAPEGAFSRWGRGERRRHRSRFDLIRALSNGIRDG